MQGDEGRLGGEGGVGARTERVGVLLWGQEGSGGVERRWGVGVEKHSSIASAAEMLMLIV